jgi:hypothetical protein
MLLLGQEFEGDLTLLAYSSISHAVAPIDSAQGIGRRILVAHAVGDGKHMASDLADAPAASGRG